MMFGAKSDDLVFLKIGRVSEKVVEKFFKNKPGEKSHACKKKVYIQMGICDHMCVYHKYNERRRIIYKYLDLTYVCKKPKLLK
jgi:hypothetical protein